MSNVQSFKNGVFCGRRDALKAIVGGTTLLAMGKVLPAADPIARTGKPFFKLSLAAYSFNRQLGRPDRGKPGEMDLFDFIDFCAEQDLAGTELTGYYFPQDATHDYLLRLKERTFRLGLDISGTAIGNNFCVADEAQWQREIEMTRHWIETASTIGAPVIRIFAGSISKGDSEDAALDRCVKAIDLSLEHAAQHGVMLALENHGGITATADQLLRIVERVQPSEWFGVNFDSGNFHTADPYADMQRIAPYAVNAQLKIAVQPAGSPKQPTDFRRVVSILQDAGYRGYLVLEYEEAEDPREAIPRHLDELRQILAEPA